MLSIEQSTVSHQSVKYEEKKLDEVLIDTITNKPNKIVQIHFQIQNKYRWIILVLYSLSNMMNALLNATFTSISTQIEQAYNQSQFMVSMTSLVWMFLYIIFNFPSNYVIDKKGLKFGVLLSTILTATGSWIRLFINSHYGWAIFGQILGGIGQPLIQNAPPQIASVWFKPHQRQLATSLLCITNSIGQGAGYLFPSLIVSNSYSSSTRNQVYNLMLYQAIIISACSLPTLLLFREKPPSPPSLTAETTKYSLKKSMKTMLSDINFIYLSVSFGLIIGNFNCITTVIDFYLEQFQFDSVMLFLILVGGYYLTVFYKLINQHDSSIIGFVFIFSGILGSLAITQLAAKYNKYKKIFLITSVFSIASYISQMGLMYCQNFTAMIASYFLYGFFTTSLIPLSLELSCEITYPITENISTGLLYKASQLIGVIQVLISLKFCLLSLLKSFSKQTQTIICVQVIVIKSKNSALISQLIGLSIQIVGLIIGFFFQENLKRQKAEKPHNLNKNHNSKVVLELQQKQTLSYQDNQESVSIN